MRIKKANDLIIKDAPPKKKPGRKRKPLNISYGKSLTADEIFTCKIRILELLETAQARTITEACEQLGIPSVRAHGWSRSDGEFKEGIDLAREIVADKVEAVLLDNHNMIAQMFLLKAYRPKFRENYKADLDNPKLLALLEELKRIGMNRPEQPKVTAITVVPTMIEEKPWEQLVEVEVK